MGIVLYSIHSGNLYGTERLELAIAIGLDKVFKAEFVCPPGPLRAEAEKYGIKVHIVSTLFQFAKFINSFIRKHDSFTFVSTRTSHSLILEILNCVYRRKIIHLQHILGGVTELRAYKTRIILNWLDIIFIAQSEYVKGRLIKNGVRENKIRVIDPFAINYENKPIKQRNRFVGNGVAKVIVLSRIDPIKRIDLLLSALDETPELRNLSFSVFGTGASLVELRERAARNNPNVAFCGFSKDMTNELINSDLFLHLSSVEPGGLAILAALEAGVPVLVPDEGGVASYVQDAVSGFRFRSNDVTDLSRCLLMASCAAPELLNRIAEGGRQLVNTRFSFDEKMKQYEAVFNGQR